jgi:YfiH family protein
VSGGGQQPRAVGRPPAFAAELPGARVLFSTRAGGVSRGPYESLNLGARIGDEPGHVAENRRRLAAATGLPAAAVAIGSQVHGTALEHWTAPSAHGFDAVDAPRPEVDGHVTALRGVGLLVQVADCLPVALATGGQVAMLHCGWRGVAAGIVARAVGELDAVPAAVIGPGIGRCCFEVGPEVAAEFADVAGAAEPAPRAGHALLDLRRVTEARLRAAGVERVEHVDLCTGCNPQLFFSHRRDDGVSGRQCGIVWRT